MGTHSQQQSIQQSTYIICNGSASLKLEKYIFNTINKTISAHPVNNNVQQQWCNNGTMGTVQPAGWIWRCQCWVDARMCVGIKGRQGGAPGGRNGGVKMRILIMQLGSQVFFANMMHSSWYVTTPSNSMAHIWCGAIGYSWLDKLLRNPWSGVQTPQVLGYSGLRVAEPLVRG